MKNIKQEIEDKMNELNALNKDLKKAYDKEYHPIFDDHVELQQALTDLENGEFSALGIESDGLLNAYVRFDFNQFKEDENVFESFERYIEKECGIYIDNFNEALSICLGSPIIVTDDNRVYDCDNDTTVFEFDSDTPKLIVDYEIESYQEGNGCWDYIVKSDYYGNVEEYNLDLEKLRSTDIYQCVECDEMQLTNIKCECGCEEFNTKERIK